MDKPRPEQPGVTSISALERYMPMPPTRSSADAFPGWTAIHVRLYRLPPGQVTLPALDCPRIVVFLSTRSLHLARGMGGVTSMAEPALDSININPAGQPIHWEWDSFMEIVQMQLCQPLLQRLVSKHGVDVERLCRLDKLNFHDAMIAQVGHELADLLEDPQRSVSLAYLDALADFLGLHVAERYCGTDAGEAAEEPQHAAAFRRIVDFVHANLDKDLRLDQLARMARLSNFYFIRQFKAALGKTPHQYIQDVRIELAKQLLRDTYLPLGEISQRCGFSTQSHFTSSFGQVVGASPRAYRQAHAGTRSKH